MLRMDCHKMSGYFNEAEEKIQALGERSTIARLKILEALLTSSTALSHWELEQRFQKGINRVTIYRVLDWLTEKRLAHKISGDDRVWRFTAGDGHLHQHAHFHCGRCGQIICLEEVNLAYVIPLPEGFFSRHIEMTVKGDCAKCRQK